MVIVSIAIAHMASACADRAPVKKEDVMIETIEYWTNAVDDAFPTRLTLARVGAATLEVTSNEDNPAVPNIGRFSNTPDKAAVDQLTKSVAAAAFANHPNPGPVEPGGVIRRIHVWFTDGHEVQRHVTEAVPADPDFAQAEHAALRIVADVRRHPQQAVAIDIKVMPGATREQRVFSVTLSNVGKETLTVPHPSRWAETGMALHVTARRSDVPLAQMSNEHQTFLDLGAQALVAAPLPVVPRITLAPGQKQDFSFTAQLALLPGKYEVWGALTVQLFSADGNELLVGELVSPKLPLVP